MGPPASASASPGPTPPSAKLNKKTSPKRKVSTSALATTPNGGPAVPIYQATPSGNEVNAPSTTGSAASSNGKISTTPVPIPRLPGMTPHQAAAQAMKQTPIPAYPFPQAPPNGVPAAHSADIPMPDAAALPQAELAGTQEFPDVPGSESMEFMEKMMANLRKVSHD